MRLVLLLILPLLSSCAPVEPAEQQDISLLDCPPVHSSFEIKKGDVISSNLRSLQIDNGIVRLRYGGHELDFRDTGVTVENNGTHLEHVLAARHTDSPEVASDPSCTSSSCHSNGTHWHDAVHPWYGDGSKYVLTPNSDANRVVVLEYSDKAVELSYEWDELRLDGVRSPGVCQLGKFPECGPTNLDTEGGLVYRRDGETVKSIKKVKLWKVVRIQRCDSGYYTSLRSDPPLIWPEQGSRAFRLGYLSSVVTWTCNGDRVFRHPNSPAHHYDMGVTDCIADIPMVLPNHNSWPFIRFMKVSYPTRFNSLQYSANQMGSPGSQDVYDHLGPDGRALPYQAFIGAVELPHQSGSDQEPSAETITTIQNLTRNIFN